MDDPEGNRDEETEQNSEGDEPVTTAWSVLKNAKEMLALMPGYDLDIRTRILPIAPHVTLFLYEKGRI